jgi:hypothetical protein
MKLKMKNRFFINSLNNLIQEFEKGKKKNTFSQETDNNEKILEKEILSF